MGLIILAILQDFRFRVYRDLRLPRAPAGRSPHPRRRHLPALEATQLKQKRNKQRWDWCSAEIYNIYV